MLSDVIFEPASRTVTIPPDASLQDFTLAVAPVEVSLTPGLTTTLTFTDSQGLPTHLLFPPDAVSEQTTIIVTPITGSSGSGLAYAGHAFNCAALVIVSRIWRLG